MGSIWVVFTRLNEKNNFVENKELIKILTDIIYSDESNEEFHIAIKKGIMFLDALKRGQKLPIYIVSDSVICGNCGKDKAEDCSNCPDNACDSMLPD